MTDLQRLLEELNQGFHGAVVRAVRVLLERAIAEDQAKVSVKGSFKKALGLEEVFSEVVVDPTLPDGSIVMELKDRLDKSEAWIKELGERNSEQIEDLTESLTKEVEARRLAEEASLDAGQKVYQLLDKLRKTEERESQRVKAQLEKLLEKDGIISELNDRLEAAVNERNSALIHSRDLQTKLQIRDKEIDRLNERIEELEAEAKDLKAGKHDADEAQKKAWKSVKGIEAELRNEIQAHKATIKHLHDRIAESKAMASEILRIDE